MITIKVTEYDNPMYMKKVFDKIYKELSSFNISEKNERYIPRDILELIKNSYEHCECKESILSIDKKGDMILISYAEINGAFYTQTYVKNMFESKTFIKTKKVGKGGHGLKNYILKRPSNVIVNTQKGELILKYKEEL